MTSFDVDLDRSSPIPLYHQIAEQLHRSIRSGELEPGSLLGNEIRLADRLGLSRPTMRRAIGELVDKGVLVRKRGVGTQVVQGPITRSVQLSSLFDDLSSSDQHPATAVLTNEVVPASDEVAAALKLPRRSSVLHLRRVRFALGKPLAILENHLPDHLVEIGDADLGSAGLYQLMRAAGVRMKVAKQRIGAREGSENECALLEEPADSPMLTMDRLTHDDTGTTLEWGRHVYRASRYDFAVTLVGR